MRFAPLYLAIALALAVLMPSAGSLWIDELQTYQHVAPPTFHAWLENFRANTFSEALMPLSMLVAWLQGKVFGLSEWGLRAPNILWTWLAILAVAVCGRQWRWPAAPLFFAVQPFVWYCANEARPYSLQIACGAWMAAGGVRMMSDGAFRGWPLYAFTAAAAALLASTLFGIVTVGLAIVALMVFAWARRRPVSREAWLSLAVLILWGGVLGFYYLQKLRAGSAGAKIWVPGFSNLLFALYEFAGFQGLGFPRDELRAFGRAGGPLAVLRSSGWSLLGLALLGAVLATLLAGAWRAGRRPELRPHVLALAAVFGGVFAATSVLSMAAGFPFWGRHVAPAFAFYYLLLLIGAATLYARIATQGQRALFAGGTLALFFASSAMLRWSPVHARDDYRGASQIAAVALAQGKRVWWNAAGEGPAYYHVPGTRAAEDATAVFLMEPPTEESLAPLTPPDVIVTSKSDTFDPGSVLQHYCEAKGYAPTHKLKAFTIWERTSAGVSLPVAADGQSLAPALH